MHGRVFAGGVSMSLRDEHLAKALKHAPDSDLAPSETVRKKVLAHATKVNMASQKPHGYWLARLLPSMKNWQWAGMSSVAVALLAMLMLREQLPPEMTQPDAAPKVLAQNKASEKALKEELADMAASSASIQAEAPARNINRKAKTETPDAAPEMADKTVIAALPEVLAPSPQSAPVGLTKQDDSVVAQNTVRVEAAPSVSASASDAVAAAEKKSEAENSNAAAKKSGMLVDAGALGVAKANRDIQAGVLRILVAEWPADKPLVDEMTGYRVELAADLVPEELEAYNQAMRDWFEAHN
jgi:hypothetical protein